MKSGFDAHAEKLEIYYSVFCGV